MMLLSIGTRECCYCQLNLEKVPIANKTSKVSIINWTLKKLLLTIRLRESCCCQLDLEMLLLSIGPRKVAIVFVGRASFHVPQLQTHCTLRLVPNFLTCYAQTVPTTAIDSVQRLKQFHRIHCVLFTCP